MATSAPNFSALCERAAGGSATGVKYRKLNLPSLPRYEGAGVYYCATHLESQLCVDQEVAVVGGGNSAGQAAMYFAGAAARVHMVVRGPDSPRACRTI